jgi:hemerythrin-like domain-containing protein
MKRHAALQQLSREHHTALKLARLARFASDSGNPDAISEAAKTIFEQFQEEVDAHFDKEEIELLPALEACGETELVRRTLAEHGELRALNQQLSDPNAETLAHFGKLLYDHVRFEERELFETAQSRLYPE